MTMYHTISNLAADYVVSPLSKYVLSPVLNFVGDWGGNAVANFIGDWGGRAVFNFFADTLGARAAVNLAVNNPHAALATGAALAGAKWAYDKGHTPKAALTAFNNHRKASAITAKPTVPPLKVTQEVTQEVPAGAPETVTTEQKKNSPRLGGGGSED